MGKTSNLVKSGLCLYVSAPVPQSLPGGKHCSQQLQPSICSLQKSEVNVDSSLSSNHNIASLSGNPVNSAFKWIQNVAKYQHPLIHASSNYLWSIAIACSYFLCFHHYLLLLSSWQPEPSFKNVNQILPLLYSEPSIHFPCYLEENPI